MKDVLSALPAFARCNELAYCEVLYSSSMETVPNQEVKSAGPDKANLVTSRVAGDTHIPLIDVDMDAALLPSSTPGHHHLYINKPMSYENYMKLLRVMAEVGIVQNGVLKAAEQQGYTSLRMPHIKKHDEQLSLFKSKEGSGALEATIGKIMDKITFEGAKHMLDGGSYFGSNLAGS